MKVFWCSYNDDDGSVAGRASGDSGCGSCGDGNKSSYIDDSGDGTFNGVCTGSGDAFGDYDCDDGGGERSGAYDGSGESAGVVECDVWGNGDSRFDANHRGDSTTTSIIVSSPLLSTTLSIPSPSLLPSQAPLRSPSL